EELCRLARRLHCRGEVARLTVEFRGLERAVSNDHRGVELVEMALRAQRLLHLVREVDVAAARREAHRLEVEHAAATKAALHGGGREIEILGPFGGENHACEMAA